MYKVEWFRVVFQASWFNAFFLCCYQEITKKMTSWDLTPLLFSYFNISTSSDSLLLAVASLHVWKGDFVKGVGHSLIFPLPLSRFLWPFCSHTQTGTCRDYSHLAGCFQKHLERFPRKWGPLLCSSLLSASCTSHVGPVKTLLLADALSFLYIF